MRHSPKFSTVLVAILSVAALTTGCDKLSGFSKPSETASPPPVPVVQAPVAVPPAAPAPAAAAAAAAVVVPPTEKHEPSLEVRAHTTQAFSYISMAKNARDAVIREENIDNALREFSMAIQKDPLYAEAYSNRAATYMQLKKFNKAEEDLHRAKELSPDSPSVRYNYASLHSLKGNVDLALDEIDAALSKGFSDYDALRLDPDLNNVRKHPEFRKILEKHKVFIVK